MGFKIDIPLGPFGQITQPSEFISQIGTREQPCDHLPTRAPHTSDAKTSKLITSKKNLPPRPRVPLRPGNVALFRNCAPSRSTCSEILQKARGAWTTSRKFRAGKLCTFPWIRNAVGSCACSSGKGVQLTWETERHNNDHTRQSGIRAAARAPSETGEYLT